MVPAFIKLDLDKFIRDDILSKLGNDQKETKDYFALLLTPYKSIGIKFIATKVTSEAIFEFRMPVADAFTGSWIIERGEEVSSLFGTMMQGSTSFENRTLFSVSS